MLPTLLAIISVMNAVYSGDCSDPTDSDDYPNPVTANYVTYCDLHVTLRAQLKVKFDATTFHDAISKFVRLIFHDCMGPLEHHMNASSRISICDGCISFANDAHSDLENSAVKKLENTYKDEVNNWKNRITRADFWAAAGTLAVQYADELSRTTDLHGSTPNPNQTIPYIPFYIGRTSCSASPDVNLTNYASPYVAFPDALAGWDYNSNLFQEMFGFTNREYVAILGAHTLGRVHANASGFGTVAGSPWVQAWDILDNEFYNVLLDDGTRTNRHVNWTQNLNLKNKYEWRSEDGSVTGSRFVMLNADMALVKDFDDEFDTQTGGGKCKCTYSTCANNTMPKGIVQQYANDNQVWLTDFGNTFEKMILTGYRDSNGDTQLTVLAEQWYLTQNGLDGQEIITCDPPTEWSKIYTGVSSFRERRDGPGWLVTATADFIVNDTDCVSGNELTTYLYDFTYSGKQTAILTIHLIVCCGDGASWANSYVFPDGYQQNGAFIDGDTDFGDDEIETKEIVVYCIIGVMLLCCLGIIGYIFYKKKLSKNNKLKADLAELHDSDMSSNGNNDVEANTTTTIQ